ncbi:amidohydrolase [Mycolicibacterium helvum]|uniref:Amidohydrolase n=1 Tax=Mycolicibacterium helvum TaxID=1534349 RepID=A0A7I7T0K1_9MYCO|nr:amidohydrolase family protein [Mycolicibacterium helvum]BBY62061.1 amidohydrolase [Mycolicibacterium helvum]
MSSAYSARPLASLKTDAPSEYILTGGSILGGDAFTICGALHIADGQIVAIGDQADLFDDRIPVYDLDGAVALPGLHDTHFHMMSTGANKRAVDLSSCQSVAEVLDRVACAPAAAGTDWVIAGQLDEARLQEGRAPTLAELDQVCPDRPLYINDRGLHYSLINSVAADLLDLQAAARDYAGRMQESLSGLAKERLGAVLPLEYAQENLRFAAQYAADLGLTTLHAIEGGELFDDRDVAVLRNLHANLPVRVHILWSTEDVAAIAAAGYRHGGGDVCADGSLGSRTARLSVAYDDAPEELGVTLRDRDTLIALFSHAERLGIQFGVHAIGDVAVADAVEAIAAVCAPGNPLRHRVEHFGMPSMEVIARAAEVRVGVSTQPGFAYLRGQRDGVYASRLGAERLAAAYPLRTLLDAGLIVSGGSDSDVTSADPFLGIHSAVNHPQHAERLTPAEALTMYTGSAEWMAGGDPTQAYLVERTRADVTVADANPLAVAPDAIEGIAAVATIVGGRSVGR